MSLREMPFEALATELADAVRAVTGAAPRVTAVAESSPAVVPTVLVDGVARPVEDLVVAREQLGITYAVDGFRRHMVQAVLHARAAADHSGDAVAAFDSAGE